MYLLALTLYNTALDSALVFSHYVVIFKQSHIMLNIHLTHNIRWNHQRLSPSYLSVLT